jgi:hypothetical protein
MSSPETEADDSAAMAAAMGFSGFGMQSRPSKKRRFNPRADASTTSAGPDLHNMPPKPPATAANSTPVGVPRPRSNLPLHPTQPAAVVPEDNAPPSTNADEGYSTDPDPPPAYVDTSRPVGAPSEADVPPTAEEAAAVRAEMDAVVAAGNATYARLPAHFEGGEESPTLDGQWLSRDQRHGFEPETVDATAGRGQGSISAVGGFFHAPESSGGLAGSSSPGSSSFRGGYGGPRGGRRGRGGGFGGRGGLERDGSTPWYDGYYDPAFNANPWAKLEASMCLESKRTWIERSSERQRV